MSRGPIAITGAAGVIGGVLASRLSGAYQLRLIDRRPVPAGGGIRVDLRDRDGLEDAFAGADAVIHLAASTSVGASWEDVLEANIVGTRHVLEAARATCVPRVVLASSNHVVGMYELDGAPAIYSGEASRRLGAEVAARPDSLYGVSKAFGELLGRYYADVHGLRVICLRIGTVLASDDPTAPAPAGAGAWSPAPWEQRIRATWLSHGDCAELFRCALEADVRYSVVYGVSNVPGRFWDLEGAREHLGWQPVDAFPTEEPRNAAARPDTGSGPAEGG
jgi:nucleoside-diphosphate-sugar epimerase